MEFDRRQSSSGPTAQAPSLLSTSASWVTTLRSRCSDPLLRVEAHLLLFQVGLCPPASTLLAASGLMLFVHSTSTAFQPLLILGHVHYPQQPLKVGTTTTAAEMRGPRQGICPCPSPMALGAPTLTVGSVCGRHPTEAARTGWRPMRDHAARVPGASLRASWATGTLVHSLVPRGGYKLLQQTVCLQNQTDNRPQLPSACTCSWPGLLSKVTLDVSYDPSPGTWPKHEDSVL